MPALMLNWVAPPPSARIWRGIPVRRARAAIARADRPARLAGSIGWYWRRSGARPPPKVNVPLKFCGRDVVVGLRRADARRIARNARRERWRCSSAIRSCSACRRCGRCEAPPPLNDPSTWISGACVLGICVAGAAEILEARFVDRGAVHGGFGDLHGVDWCTACGSRARCRSKPPMPASWISAWVQA